MLNPNRAVDKPDDNLVKAQIGMPITSANFRQDIVPNGAIQRNDAGDVKTHKGKSLP